MESKRISALSNELIFKLVFGQEGSEEMTGKKPGKAAAASRGVRQKLTSDIMGDIIPL